MGITVQIDNRKDFEAIAEMIQPGVLADIVDLGMQPNPFKNGAMQHKVRFVWIVAEEDSEGRQKRVFERFTLSLNEKATLRKRIKEIRGRDLNAEESAPGASFDIETLVGSQRVLVLTQEDAKKPGDKPFIKVTATMPSKKGQTVTVPSDFVRAKDKPTQ